MDPSSIINDMNRRESVGRLKARTQSASGPPTQEFVSVCVLPPRLPRGMAPPTGLGVADVFSWDESINWQHNEPDKEQPVSKSKALLRKAGLTTQRAKRNPDLPPSIMRQVPYDTWRKHYAKDKDGNYRGTHAPAEDCLLKPDDVAKWRLGPAVTKADRWTRGLEVLPVYAEVKENGTLPEYEHDYDGPPRTEPPQTEPPAPYRDVTQAMDSARLDDDDEVLASHLEKKTSNPTPDSFSYSNDLSSSTPRSDSSASQPTQRTNSSTSQVTKQEWKQNANIPTGKIITDGKTAQEVIAEAEAKGTAKLGWKKYIQKGVETAILGGGTGGIG